MKIDAAGLYLRRQSVPDGLPFAFVGDAVVGVAAGALVLMGVLVVQRVLRIFK